MNQGDWDAFNDGVDKLFKSGAYARLVSHHSAMDHSSGGHMALHRMHGSMAGDLGFLRFLPWHRAYLVAFERALRRIEPKAFVSYWDWIEDPYIPKKVIALPNNARHGKKVNFATKSLIKSILANSQYYDFTYDFTYDLEVGPHNDGHNWIGGIMANPMFSPRDPMFWLHHANVDRIWHVWQSKAANAGKKGDFSAYDKKEEKLDPWELEFDIHSVDCIECLGNDSYIYEKT